MTRCSKGPRDLRGIDIEGLNRMASLSALSRKELVLVCNATWEDIYGHKVIYE